jgi:hypothetical protein
MDVPKDKGHLVFIDKAPRVLFHVGPNENPDESEVEVEYKSHKL